MPTFAGSFAANTSPGNQSVTGLGFQPDVVLFLGVGETAAGNGTGDALMSWGAGYDFGGGTLGYSHSYLEKDAGTQSETYHYNEQGVSDHCVSFPRSLTVVEAAQFVSTDSDGFTVNWGGGIGASAPAAARLVFFLAFTVEDVNTSGDNPDVSTVGDTAEIDFGFEPTFVMGTCSIGSGLGGDAVLSLGAATDTTERGEAIIVSGTSRPTRSESSLQRTDSLLSSVFGTFTTNADGERIDVHSWDSDGITVICESTGNDGSFEAISWLGTLLPYAKVGSDTQKTSTGTKSVTGLGFEPDGVLLFSIGQTSSTSTFNDANLTIGLVGSNGECSGWVGGVQDSDPIQTGTSASTSKAIMFLDTPGTVVAEADCTLDSDGFTLNWTTADGTAREFVYLAFQSYGFVAQTFVPQIYRVWRG